MRKSLKVFISYRQTDLDGRAPALVGRISNHLAGHYGRGNVFMGAGPIPPGVRLDTHIESAVAKADIFLAVVGKQWLGQLQARQGEKNDLVRLEIEAALKTAMPMELLLVGGARIPKATDLPPKLAPFIRHNASSVDTNEDFEADMTNLIDELDSEYGAGNGEVPPAIPPAKVAKVPRLPHPLRKQPLGAWRWVLAAGACMAGGILLGVHQPWKAGRVPEVERKPSRPLAPVTPPPVSSAPVTPPPVSSAPVTPPPVSSAPVTPPPISSAPVTPPPVSSAPVTPPPVASAPVTPPPVASAPVPARSAPIPSPRPTPVPAPAPAPSPVIRPIPTTSPTAAGQNFTNELGMKMIWCPPGIFQMGSPESEAGRFDNETRHQVTLTRGFWIAQTEVTQEQWQKIMGSHPGSVTLSGPPAPVGSVSWDQAVEFCRKLTETARTAGSLPAGEQYTLPTEAQWEYACRAGSTGPYNVDSAKLDELAWYNSNSENKPHPVGLKRPNAWGLHDMLGNVVEWCLDWHGEYPKGAVTDPAGSSQGSRKSHLIRGGCWTGGARGCRSAYRFGWAPEASDNYLGFRPIRFVVSSSMPRE